MSVQRQVDTPAKTMPPEAEGVSPGSRSNRQTGAVAAEFALVLIPFLLVLFGIIDFGHFFWTDHVVTEAAREGARWAILNEPSNAEVQGAITQKMADGGISATPTISISGRTPRQAVTVTVTVPFEFLLLSGLVSAVTSIDTVSATVTMLHEP